MSYRKASRPQYSQVRAKPKPLFKAKPSDHTKWVEGNTGKVRKYDFHPEWVFRIRLGHYGGGYVEVPAEHWTEFEAFMPKAYMPKDISLVDLRDYRSSLNQKFADHYPNSGSGAYIVHFANGSKGWRQMEEAYEELGLPMEGVGNEL